MVRVNDQFHDVSKVYVICQSTSKVIINILLSWPCTALGYARRTTRVLNQILLMTDCLNQNPVKDLRLYTISTCICHGYYVLSYLSSENRTTTEMDLLKVVYFDQRTAAIYSIYNPQWQIEHCQGWCCHIRRKILLVLLDSTRLQYSGTSKRIV